MLRSLMKKRHQALFGPDTVGMTIQDPDGAPVEIVGVVKQASGAIPRAIGVRRQFTSMTSDSLAHSRIAGARFRAPLTAAHQALK